MTVKRWKWPQTKAFYLETLILWSIKNSILKYLFLFLKHIQKIKFAINNNNYVLVSTDLIKKLKKNKISFFQNELTVLIMKETYEIDNLKRKVEDAEMKLVAEIKVRHLFLQHLYHRMKMGDNLERWFIVKCACEKTFSLLICS